MSEKSLQFESERHFHQLYGENPENLQEIEKILGLKIVARGDLLKIEGDEKAMMQCEELFALEMGREQGMVTKKSDFMRFLDKVSKGRGKSFATYSKTRWSLKSARNLLSLATWGSRF